MKVTVVLELEITSAGIYIRSTLPAYRNNAKKHTRCKRFRMVKFALEIDRYIGLTDIIGRYLGFADISVSAKNGRFYRPQ